MRPARIAAPDDTARRALAIPFRHGSARRVVVAELGALSAGDQPLLSVLEQMTVPSGETAAPRDDLPSLPVEPVIVMLAVCGPVRSRILEAGRRRGWPVHAVGRLPDLYEFLSSQMPDIVVVDSDEIADAAHALHRIHHVARDLQVVVIGSSERLPSEAAPLVDTLIPHDAGEPEIFAALKRASREIPRSRTAKLARSQHAAVQDIERITAPDRLAQFAAQRAAEIMGGWAGVVLLSESGAAYRAEQPAFGGAILSSIPSGFLNDVPIFCGTIDAEFLSEVFDNVRQQQALMELAPVSGALLPITLGSHRLGVMLAVSRDRGASDEAFVAAETLANAVGHRFANLTSSARQIPEFERRGSWTRWCHDMLEITVYCSAACTLPWRYRPLPESRGLLTVGVPDEPATFRRFEQV
ncbi:MAG: hypothetical protein JO058_06980, partial [Alphaproteobacteria bacterium]|nr:hypothetical protein [Alphaproteobacteria bacterium]